MSYTAIAIILTLVAVLFYGVFLLYGTWSTKTDGRRQAVGEEGPHPTTKRNGKMHAQEDEHDT